MKRRLRQLKDVEVIMPKHINVKINIEEDGKTAEENAIKKARTSLSNGFTTDLQFMKELRYEKEQDLFYGYLLLYLKCCMHSIVIIQE